MLKTRVCKKTKNIIDHVVVAARLTESEIEIVNNSLVPDIIIETAYQSGCIDPDRVAVGHLITFIGAFRCRDISDHRNGESLRNRIETIGHYPGGNIETVKAGMLLLELLSLNDHLEDIEKDLIKGKTNPLISAGFNYEKEKARIDREYMGLSESVKKSFKYLHDKVIKAGFWAG